MENFPRKVGLGTLLRHLTEMMDGEVDRIYEEEGLTCRSRFTPVIRHIDAHGPSTIKAIALASGVTHSAVSQTVSSMLRAGLLRSQTGSDGRERIISFSAKGKALVPKLQRVWTAIGKVEEELSQDGGVPLRSALQRTIEMLRDSAFQERIRQHL